MPTCMSNIKLFVGAHWGLAKLVGEKKRGEIGELPIEGGPMVKSLFGWFSWFANHTLFH